MNSWVPHTNKVRSRGEETAEKNGGQFSRPGACLSQHATAPHHALQPGQVPSCNRRHQHRLCIAMHCTLVHAPPSQASLPLHEDPARLQRRLLQALTRRARVESFECRRKMSTPAHERRAAAATLALRMAQSHMMHSLPPPGTATLILQLFPPPSLPHPAMMAPRARQVLHIGRSMLAQSSATPPPQSVLCRWRCPL